MEAVGVGALLARTLPPTCQLPPTQFADLAAGSLRAVIGILLALLARQFSGVGQHVDVAMMQGAVSFHVEALAYLNAQQSARVGEMPLTGRYPCYQLYRTRDGRFMAVAATEPQFWRNLCDVLELPDLVDHQYAEGEDATVAMARAGGTFRHSDRSGVGARLGGERDVLHPRAHSGRGDRARRAKRPRPRHGATGEERVADPPVPEPGHAEQKSRRLRASGTRPRRAPRRDPLRAGSFAPAGLSWRRTTFSTRSSGLHGTLRRPEHASLPCSPWKGSVDSRDGP